MGARFAHSRSQKRARVAASEQFLGLFQSNSKEFLRRYVTVNEMWIHYFRNDSRVCGDWLLHHDNAPAHSSNLVQQFLSKHSIALLRQPPYSPDIALCDFWLFPKLKKPLKGQRFDDKTTVGNNATSVLKAIPKSEFQDCFEKWKYRWNRVIQSSGNYFEGCHLPDDEE